MDYASLIAAIPAMTVSATDGLSSTDEVYVADQRRVASETVEAWWRQVDFETVRETLAQSVVRYTFELRLSKASGTRAELVLWSRQIRAYLVGRRRLPTITGLIGWECSDAVLDDNPGEGPDVEAVLTVGVVGNETTEAS